MPKRYEEEINEILHKFDDWPPADKRARRPRSEPPRGSDKPPTFDRFFDHIGPQQIMAVGLVLILLGVLLRFSLRFGIDLSFGVYTVVLGLALLLAGYLMAVIQGGSGRGSVHPGQTVWRGQVIDLRPSNRGLGYWFWRFRANLRRGR